MPNQFKLGVIANPNSAACNSQKRYGKALEQQLFRSDELVWTRKANCIAQTLKNFQAAQIDLLGIFGGDGTIRATLQEASRIWPEGGLPRVVLLRGGTMNVISYSLGMRGSPISILKKLQKLRLQNNALPSRQVYMQRIGQYCGFIFGLGSFTHFLAEYYRHRRPGPLVAAKLMAQLITSTIFRTALSQRVFKRIEAQVQVDEKQVKPTRYTLLTSSTVPYAGLGFSPFYLSSSSDKPIHLITSNANPFKLAANAIQFFFGWPALSKEIDNCSVNHIKIDAANSHPIFIDGEMLETSFPLIIRTGSLIDVITPC